MFHEHQFSIMKSLGSCDTEDHVNDAEKLALLQDQNILNILQII